MQHVLVDLRYEKAYIFNNSKKCNYCNFLFLMPPTLDARGRRPVRPSPLYTPLLEHSMALGTNKDRYFFLIFCAINPGLQCQV